MFNITGAADIPGVDSTSENFAGYGSSGISLYADVATTNGDIRGFLNGNMNVYLGSDVFQSNLGTSQKAFLFGQLSAGVVLGNVFKVSFAIYNFGSEKVLNSKKVIVGAQVVQ